MGMKVLLVVLMLSAISFAQGAQKVKKSAPVPDQSQSQQSTSQPTDSSSKDSKIDLSPPKGDDVAHSNPDDDANSDVVETKPWNPHKAAKDIEVGDFYAKRKNYKAAISRYREALEYKPKDAEATFKLAQCLEATKATDEAVQRYQEYLKILPNGDYAAEAKAAVARLKPKA